MSPMMKLRGLEYNNIMMNLLASTSTQYYDTAAAKASISLRVHHVLHMHQQGHPDALCELPPENMHYFTPLATFLSPSTAADYVSRLVDRFKDMETSAFEFLMQYLLYFSSAAAKTTISNKLKLEFDIHLHHDMELVDIASDNEMEEC